MGSMDCPHEHIYPIKSRHDIKTDPQSSMPLMAKPCCLHNGFRYEPFHMTLSILCFILLGSSMLVVLLVPTTFLTGYISYIIMDTQDAPGLWDILAVAQFLPVVYSGSVLLELFAYFGWILTKLIHTNDKPTIFTFPVTTFYLHLMEVIETLTSLPTGKRPRGQVSSC